MPLFKKIKKENYKEKQVSKTIRTDLIRPECGCIFPIMRRECNQKKAFHRKYLYCPTCKKTTNQLEMKEYDKLLEMIDRKEDASMTEDEKKVYKLLRKRSDNNESRGTTSIW